MATTLFQLPFNGSVNSTGTSPVTATLTGGQYVPGRIGNQAISFATEGHVEILQKAVPIGGTYILSFWIKVLQQADGPTASWMLFKFAGLDRFIYVDLNSTLTSWSYVVIVQDTDRVSAYVNGRLTETELFPAGWGKPVGFSMVNDSSSKTGYMTLEDVTLYSGTDATLPPQTPTPVPELHVQYFINGLNFQSYGVSVSASDGLLGNLTMKEPQRFEWPDYHGEVIDLGSVRYQPRVITLTCFMQADSVDSFIERVNLFLGQFTRSATQRLKVNVHSTKPLVYEVYLRDAVNLKKKWSADGMVGTFELTLIEPEPVKRVLQFGSGTASITLSSNKVVSIHWGDKTHTYDVFGLAKTITHTYSTPGPHEIIVAGVVEDITAFTSNATVLWSRL